VKQNLSGRAALALALAVILWGSAPVGIRDALQGYAPGQLAFFRFFIGSLVLAVYALTNPVRIPDRRDLPIIVLAGAVGITIYNTVLNYGLITVPAGTASFLIASTPVWTSLLAVFTLGERLTLFGWLGIFVSFFGIGLIASQRGGGLHFSSGALIIVGAAILYGLYLVLQKKILGQYRALEFTCYSFWFGTLLMAPFGRGLVHIATSAPLHATMSVIYLGIFPAAIANFAWAYAMTHTPAARLSSFLYLMPVVSVVIAWMWLGEVPRAMTLVGGTFALAGVVLVNTLGKARIAVGVPALAPEVES
jgi:drug/metabolite transporter (DMT)-like permease